MDDDRAGRDIDGSNGDDCGRACPTCFLHVPKSAGLSISTALEAALSPGSLAPQRFDTSVFCDFEDFELLSSETRAKIAIDPHEVRSLCRYPAIAGHFCLDTLLRITDASSICTVLREPRSRLLSLYMYWRTPGIGDAWTPYRADLYAQRPLSEFLSEPRLAPVIDNQLCRLLLAGDPRFPPRAFAAQSDVAAIAADSIGRLQTLGFVGVLELGDSAWDGVARTFGVTLDPTVVNVTGDTLHPLAARTNEELFNTDSLDLIEQHCAADLIVYDHALARAGLDTRERRRVTDTAFAAQLVKFGDLIGHSAARAIEQSKATDAWGNLAEEQKQAADLLHNQLNERERSSQQVLRRLRKKLRLQELAVQQGREELKIARYWLDAIEASASWRLTSPLRAGKRGMQRLWPADRDEPATGRQPSLIPRWSVRQIVGTALILTLIIAATDAVLTNSVILIPLLVVGPICGLLTGQRVVTAALGVWVAVLAVALCVPDEIWDTKAQLVYLGIVGTAVLVSNLAVH